MSAKQTTTLRLRRIRFKDGRTLNVLRPPNNEPEMRAKIADIIRVHVDSGDDVDGFAFVVWGRNGGSTARAYVGNFLSEMLIPDFVRERLMAEQIIRWVDK